MIAHRWQPIQPIDTTSEQYDFSEIDSLQQQWLSIRERMEQDNSDTYKVFLERLGRSWAIETGLIEGLYTLDRGVTETLIERGIAEDFVERRDTNRDPQELVTVLKDQEDAIDFVYKYIREGHPLTRSFIRQLHQVLTLHQDTYSAIDQFHQRFEATLDKGAFKKLPNNPRQDGSIHEYCPPEQVDSEIDNLLYFYNEMQSEQGSFHPLLTGAWLHHAFTKIHPFQDGNGRVVRALLTWHLVKENYLPIVISRDDRERYIETLESADGGDLIPFVDLIVQLEKRTILQALGEPEPAEPVSGVVDQVLDAIVEQMRRRNQDRANQMRSVNAIAEQLRNAAESKLSDRSAEIRRRLNESGMSVVPFQDMGGPGDREHWYQSEVITTANNAQNWVNLNEARFFVKLSLSNDLWQDSEAVRHPRLVFVISLHHVGRELTGIMAATAFALIEHYPEDDSSEIQSPATPYFKDCTVNPFTFTWESNPDAVAARFVNWTEERLGIALRYWQDFLS